MVEPDSENGRLKWTRMDYFMPEIGRLKFVPTAIYPTFEAAVKATPDDNRAVSEVARMPPQTRLLRSRKSLRVAQDAG